MGEDFSIASSVSMEFSSGSTINGDSVCIVINILEDDIYEENQDFTVRLTAIQPLSAAVFGTPDTVTKNIQDNEGWLSF